MPTVSHELATAWPRRAGTCMLVLFQEGTKDGRLSAEQHCAAFTARELTTAQKSHCSQRTLTRRAFGRGALFDGRLEHLRSTSKRKKE